MLCTYVYAMNLREYSQYSLDQLKAWALEVWPNLEEIANTQTNLKP